MPAEPVAPLKVQFGIHAAIAVFAALVWGPFGLAWAFWADTVGLAVAYLFTRGLSSRRHPIFLIGGIMFGGNVLIGEFFTLHMLSDMYAESHGEYRPSSFGFEIRPDQIFPIILGLGATGLWLLRIGFSDVRLPNPTLRIVLMHAIPFVAILVVMFVFAVSFFFPIAGDPSIETGSAVLMESIVWLTCGGLAVAALAFDYRDLKAQAPPRPECAACDGQMKKKELTVRATRGPPRTRHIVMWQCRDCNGTRPKA